MAEHVCLLSTRYPGTKQDSVADGERIESSEHPITTDPHSNLVNTILLTVDKDLCTTVTGLGVHEQGASRLPNTILYLP